jgi:hypothetical protein
MHIAFGTKAALGASGVEARTASHHHGEGVGFQP